MGHAPSPRPPGMAVEILDLSEAAAYLRIGQNRVRLRAKRGEIAAFRDGRRWRFRRIDLDAYAARQVALSFPA